MEANPCSISNYILAFAGDLLDNCNLISGRVHMNVESGGRGFDSHRGQKIFSLPRVVP